MTHPTGPTEAEASDLHRESHGTGPALLLAHGFAGSARNFRPQIRALRDAWRVLVYDARGHARSPAPEDPTAYRLTSLTRDLGRVLDAAGVGRAVVGGVSLGAALALAFARTNPERVRALVLASLPAGAGRGAVRDPRAFADAIERDGLEAAGERFVWGAESGLDPAAARLVRQGFLEHAPHALAHVLREALAELQSPVELAVGLAPIPTLLVAGGEDAVAVEASRSLAEVLPGCRSVVVAGAGHLVNLSAAREFNQIFREFLEELPVDPEPSR
jgi:pimeloyl-ACP methyl ester carboxylesterase